MKRADKKRWAAATSLPELGELVALWLEGTLASQPGYQPGCGPDPETLPLVATLSAANRAGFVTYASQPGYDGCGYDHARWVQRAAVEGFMTGAAAERLYALLKELQPDLSMVAQTSPWELNWSEARQPVTMRAGVERTWFGGRLPREDIADLYDVCTPQMRHLLGRSYQVTVIDPEWGHEGALWPVLDAFASGVRS